MSRRFAAPSELLALSSTQFLVVDSLILVYLLTLPTYIDPVALQSLEATALPLARATADMSLNVGQAITRTC